MLEENWKIADGVGTRAFLLQFNGNEDDISREILNINLCSNPVSDIRQTGLFGILDALIDLGLTNNEIIDFYIHGHVEPYADPYEFIKGIINIVYEMPKSEIKKQYGYYFDDDSIAKLPNSNNNTKMLISFCYDRDDMYVYIPNKEDLYNRFEDNYNIVFHQWNYYKAKKDFPKIDGKLYRAVHFLVRQGYDFPELESIFNETIKDIVFKQTNGENTFILNKAYAREMSDDLLNFAYFLKRNNYKFLNPESMFDSKCDSITLIDSNEKQIIFNHCYLKADLNILEMIILCRLNGYNFKDYGQIFNEKQAYFVCYDEQNQEKIFSRKQLYKCGRLLSLPYSSRKDLPDNEKDLLMMLENDNMRKKLFEWFPYTIKKWIPSSAVINKIPPEKSSEYFYNNNHQRLKVLKDLYQANDYEKMDGIISLGYILGLFDSKKSTSEKAMNYIIDYFLKKGITADELHTTYGAIDLKKNYNKQFADFFMQHYAINNQAFLEPDLGTDMTGELFARFDEILENRPEKRIKTRTKNKLLTPIDAMASITDAKIDWEILGDKADDERYFRLIQLLTKFGASQSELKWAIRLYEQALLIDEQKVNIPNITDLDASLMHFTSHLKNDPQAFLSGKKTNCCSKYGGYAEDRLTHVITDLNWRYVTFTSPNRTFFDGLVWYDKEDKVVCIDNVEGQFSQIDKNNTKSIPLMADTVIRYADGIYHKMNELNIPCIKVNVGNDPGTASWEIFEYARQQNLIYDDQNPCNYPAKNGITSDANYQFTITDENILKLRKSIK